MSFQLTEQLREEVVYKLFTSVRNLSKSKRVKAEFVSFRFISFLKASYLRLGHLLNKSNLSFEDYALQLGARYVFMCTVISSIFLSLLFL